MSTRARDGDPRDGEKVDPDVNDRLSAINGYGTQRDAGRLGSQSLDRDEPHWHDETSVDGHGSVDGEGAEHEADEHEGVGRDAHARAGQVDDTAHDDTQDYDAQDYDAQDYEDDNGDGLQEDPHDEDRAEPEQQAASSADWEGRLRAVDVHHVTFPRAAFTRRGYDERSVDEFLSRVESELVWLVEEKADLRDELARLRRQARAAQSAPVPQMEEAQAQAVRLLAKAQQLADSYVAEAEDYSKRTSQEARQHYEDLVAEARTTAAKLVDEARETAATLVTEAEEAAREAAARIAAEPVVPAPVAVAPSVPPIDPELLGRTQAEKQALEEQVAYLRTFSQVTRTQLRAYLEALLTDVEEEWGRADPAVVDSAVPAGDAAPQPRRGGSAGNRRPARVAGRRTTA